MIFKLEAPINQNISEKLTKHMVDNGVEEKLAKKLGEEFENFIFLVTDAEIAHRIPDYGEKFKEVKEDDILKSVSDIIKSHDGVTSLGVFKIE